jgi:hypothetical protein
LQIGGLHTASGKTVTGKRGIPYGDAVGKPRDPPAVRRCLQGSLRRLAAAGGVFAAEKIE